MYKCSVLLIIVIRHPDIVILENKLPVVVIKVIRHPDNYQGDYLLSYYLFYKNKCLIFYILSNFNKRKSYLFILC